MSSGGLQNRNTYELLKTFLIFSLWFDDIVNKNFPAQDLVHVAAALKILMSPFTESYLW